MSPAEAAAFLRRYNEWRRTDDRYGMPYPDPREIGEAIDAAVEMIDRLEAAEKERDNANAAAAGVALQAIELESKLEVAEKTNRGWLRANATGGWIDNLRIENDTLRAKIDQLEEDTKAAILTSNSSAQPTPSVPECPYPCGWQRLLKYAMEDGAYLARIINEDEPVTDKERAVTMRVVLQLRAVLLAIINAALEAKP